MSNLNNNLDAFMQSSDIYNNVCEQVNLIKQIVF